MALTLESIVADKAMALKFRAYLIRRHNNENFSFWVEVHEFKVCLCCWFWCCSSLVLQTCCGCNTGGWEHNRLSNVLVAVVLD